jgi:DNA repair exonuclease SbcCD ATPase subunit
VDILSVSIRNFLIVGQADVDLSNRGLCRIAGENSDDTTSSSNGAGKSSIIEGLYWGLFGETLRNIKSADGVVNNRSRKDCSVVVDLYEEGTSYRIERYRKHSKYKNNLYLFINDVDSRGRDNKETQGYIEDILGMDKMSFANSVVFGQGHGKNLKRFSEMTDSEKKETLEKILNLEVFVKSHALVKEKIKDLSQAQSLCWRDMDALGGRISSLEDRIQGAEGKSAQFHTQKREEVEKLEDKISKISSVVLSLREKLEALGSVDAEDLETSINECDTLIQGELRRKNRLVEIFTEKSSRQKSIKRGIEDKIRHFEAQTEKLAGEESVGAPCEYCGNMVTSQSIFHARDGFEFEIVDLGRSVETLEGKISTLTQAYKSRLNSIEEGIAEAEEFKKEQQSTLRRAQQGERRRAEFQAKVEAQTEVLHTYESALSKAQASENVWEAALVDYREELKALRDEEEALSEQLETLSVDLEYYSFWLAGFSRSGIRSYLLDQVVPFLNERVGHYLGILTDGGIEAKFSTVKQLSSGEYRDNFNLEISNRNAAQTYEGNSGGERRRIDLGVALGFNDFLASRSGKRFNILILDEVFEGVDADGLYFVIKVLEDISRRKSSVLVITHKDELKGYFSDEILMARKEGLSYVRG